MWVLGKQVSYLWDSCISLDHIVTLHLESARTHLRITILVILLTLHFSSLYTREFNLLIMNLVHLKII